MQSPSPILRLSEIVAAITHIRAETAGVPLDVFEADWRKRWPVERGIEIISEELEARFLWAKALRFSPPPGLTRGSTSLPAGSV